MRYVEYIEPKRLKQIDAERTKPFVTPRSPLATLGAQHATMENRSDSNTSMTNITAKGRAIDMPKACPSP